MLAYNLMLGISLTMARYLGQVPDASSGSIVPSLDFYLCVLGVAMIAGVVTLVALALFATVDAKTAWAGAINVGVVWWLALPLVAAAATDQKQIVFAAPAAIAGSYYRLRFRCDVSSGDLLAFAVLLLVAAILLLPLGLSYSMST